MNIPRAALLKFDHSEFGDLSLGLPRVRLMGDEWVTGENTIQDGPLSELIASTAAHVAVLVTKGVEEKLIHRIANRIAGVRVTRPEDVENARAIIALVRDAG